MLFHFKHADLVRGAETVFCRTEDAVIAGLLALKIKHAVHHVLEHLRPGDSTLLVDMSDDTDGHTAALGQLHERHGAVLDLTDAAGRGGAFGVIERLDGVGNQDIRRDLADGLHNGRHVGLGKQKQIFAFHVEPVGTHFDLAFTFLAGNVQNPLTFPEIGADLKQQRRFSDARRTADEHQRTAHAAPAKNAVKLPQSGGKPQLLLGIDLAERPDGRTPAGCGALPLCGGRRLLDKFLDGIPRAAGGTLALPARELVAAVFAVKNSFRFHVSLLFRKDIL